LIKRVVDRARSIVAPDQAAADFAVQRMRVLITFFFTLDGFLFANWVVRVPQIKSHVGASAGALGLALLGVSGGAVVTMVFTGRLCSRFGSRPVTVVTSALLALSIMLPSLTSSVDTLGAVLLILGAGYGGMNVAINSAAVDITKQLARPIMPTFHAAYSFGGLLGALVGGAFAEFLSPTWHLTLIGLFGLVSTLVAGVVLLRCPALPVEQRRGGAAIGEPGDTSEQSNQGGQSDLSQTPGALARPSRRAQWLVFVFGLIALCTAYGEGAMADWGALHLRSDLHTSVGIAAAGYASFSVAMLAGRLSGSRLLARLGRTTVLAAGGWLAAGGMVLAALAPSLPLVLLGFVLVGLGLANQFPAAIGQAGALTGAAGVAAASTLGYAGMLAGPPVIGFLADHVGLPVALTSIAVLAGSAAVIAVIAARVETAEQRHRIGSPAVEVR
jgi:MFS family permease